MSDLKIRPAGVEDICRVIDVVNAAYKVEIGNSGMGFKNEDRIPSLEYGINILDTLLVAQIEENIVGVMGVQHIGNDTLEVKIAMPPIPSA